MADNIGKITQIIGAVLDIKFSNGKIPEINEAIEIDNRGEKLVVEVAQQLGDDTVKCIAMGPTDGLVRGMEAVATGGPITVPVGEETLGRMFNVLGEPIDEKEAPKTKEMIKVLENVKAAKKALIVMAEKDENVVKSAANIPGVRTALVGTMNVYEIINHGSFIITQEAAKKIEEVYA